MLVALVLVDTLFHVRQFEPQIAKSPAPVIKVPDLSAFGAYIATAECTDTHMI